MSTKIVNVITDQKKLLSGAEVTAKKLKDLSENLFLRLVIKEDGKLRDMNCSDPSSRVMNDTKTAYFTKTSLDELFAANPGSNGLFIYFGVHNSNIYPLGDPNYENKLMAVLVSATDEEPNLNAGNFVEIAGAPEDIGGGMGMDNGKLCPPNTNC